MNLIITGPSGAGKDAVITGLCSIRPMFFVYEISCTTRKPRPGEKEGVDYLFVSKEVFEEWIRNNELLEYKLYNAEYYGRLKTQHEQSGKVHIYKVDIAGALTLQKLLSDHVSIAILAESEDSLHERLSKRDGLQNASDTINRMRISSEEMRMISLFDYRIINRKGALQSTIRQVMDIVDSRVAEFDGKNSKPDQSTK